MAKKVRFPLKMDDGIEVRDLEGLREHFSVQRIIEYLENGKLIVWLRDHYANDIADEIEAFDKYDKELSKKICKVFDVSYSEEMKGSIEEAEERNRKIARLKECTDDSKYIDHIDSIAFEQDDIYDLLDEDKTTIYLCGDSFSIPLAQPGITYIGVNNPIVIVDSKKKVDWDERKIKLVDIRFDDNYQKLLDACKHENEKSERNESDEITGDYDDRSIFGFLLSSQKHKEAENLFNIVVKEMGSIQYDPEKDVKSIKDYLNNSGIIGCAEDFISRL